MGHRNMRPLIQEISTAHTPESLVERLQGEAGVVLLRSALFDSPQARHSFVTARPFLTLRSFGSRCELAADGAAHVQFGNPWHVLDGLMSRYELLDEVDLPFPLGGCFGYWGYDLKNFVEPKLQRNAVNDLELPECHVGFHDSLVVFDHHLSKTWIVSTGLGVDGSRSEAQAQGQLEFWVKKLSSEESRSEREGERGDQPRQISSNLSRAEFLALVERAQRYIRAGDIYQVNLAQRLSASCDLTGWEFFQRLAAVSPAPFSAFLDRADRVVARAAAQQDTGRGVGQVARLVGFHADEVALDPVETRCARRGDAGAGVAADDIAADLAVLGIDQVDAGLGVRRCHATAGIAADIVVLYKSKIRVDQGQADAGITEQVALARGHAADRHADAAAVHRDVAGIAVDRTGCGQVDTEAVAVHPVAVALASS